jgi:hypothetical protein
LSKKEINTNLNLAPEICYFGLCGEGFGQSIGIKKEDRRRHLYILGKTGMGKTTLLENMALQDIYNGYGVCFIDPHGDSSEYILDRIPEHRLADVIYINPSDTDFPIGLNILQSQKGEQPFLIASSLMAVFKKIWSGLWSSRMEYILNNTLLALLEKPKHTLLDVMKLLTNDNYREKIVSRIQDPLVKNFWEKEFANFNTRYRQEAISPILNKIGQFLSSEIVRNIIGQTESTINLRDIIDQQKILIVNVSKGKLGEDNSNLLGSLILSKLQVVAMSTVDIPEKDRKDFYLYVDEFQNFTTDSFATILSEARKYKLNLILAHQYIAQLMEQGNPRVKNAIFGNVANLISFQIGYQDAKEIAQEFSMVFTPTELVNLERTEIVTRISTDGKPCPPILAKTIPPIFDKLNGSRDKVTELSRRRYGSSKVEVSAEISQRFSGNISEEYKDLKIKQNQKLEKKEMSNNTLEIKSPKKINSKSNLKKVAKNPVQMTEIEDLEHTDFTNTSNNDNFFELPTL